MKYFVTFAEYLAAALLTLGALELQVVTARAGSDPAVGTLAYHLSTNAGGHARGFTGKYNEMGALSGWSYAIYTNSNLGKLTNSVWSTNFWLHGVRGLSATDIGCSNGMGAQGLFTMVSPRHYLFSSHMHPEGFLAAFLDTNNVIHWRSTLERVDVTNDIGVGILNADLPASVGFLPVVPSDLLNYLPADGSSVIQGIGMNQDRWLFSQPMNFSNHSFVQWSSVMSPPFGLGTNWNVPLRSGDSSNPDMLLIGNQLVLVSHNYAINGGPSYAVEIGAINSAMHYLSKKHHLRTDYQLTQFSLKNWPQVH